MLSVKFEAAKGQNYESENESVTKFYGSDFVPASLHAQLATFNCNFVYQARSQRGFRGFERKPSKTEKGPP